MLEITRDVMSFEITTLNLIGNTCNKSGISKNTFIYHNLKCYQSFNFALRDV